MYTTCQSLYISLQKIAGNVFIYSPRRGVKGVSVDGPLLTPRKNVPKDFEFNNHLFVTFNRGKSKPLRGTLLPPSGVIGGTNPSLNLG